MSNLCLSKLVEDTSLATWVPAITWEGFVRISIRIAHDDFTTLDVSEGEVDIINLVIWDIHWLIVSSIGGPVGVVTDDLLFRTIGKELIRYFKRLLWNLVISDWYSVWTHLKEELVGSDDSSEGCDGKFVHYFNLLN
jgi:hypothetical protein